jgi:LmeA-like phospholipid-binding
MTSLALSNLPFSGQTSGDQLVSKAVSTAIAALFKQTGKLQATVRAEPVAKLLQGSLDGFDFIGQGLLMYNGLRIEAMELFVQAVAIDFGAIFKGQVQLKRPTQASLRVVLTEDDLTTSFNTPFVVEKLQRMEYENQSLHFQNTCMTLNSDKTLQIRSQIRIGDASESTDVDIKAQLQLEDRRKILFTEPQYQGTPEAIALGQALIEHVNNLLDLDKFALSGTQLRVDQVRLRNQQLVFYGVAEIEQFPQRK